MNSAYDGVSPGPSHHPPAHLLPPPHHMVSSPFAGTDHHQHHLKRSFEETTPLDYYAAAILNPYGHPASKRFQTSYPSPATGPYGSPCPTPNEIYTPSYGSIADNVLATELSLVHKLKPILIPPPVSYVYSPLEYAYEPHADYVRKYCSTPKKLLFLGMNPGPWGMSQTGVPFGEVNLVKTWLKVEGRIGKPMIEHPSRIVEGFNCPRSEVSGQRFWSYFKDLCKEPEVLFRHTYVHNYCPLAFMKDSGRNVTPPELKARERNLIFSSCDEALIKIIQLLGIEIVVGVGKFPQQRTQLALQSAGILNVRVESILHPSPVNPTANKGWRDVVHKQLVDLGLMPYICPNTSN